MVLVVVLLLLGESELGKHLEGHGRALRYNIGTVVLRYFRNPNKQKKVPFNLIISEPW
jgi:hypothetical protein